MQHSEAAWDAAPSSVREARRFVARTLEQWDVDELEWAATAIVSELASNAVLHAATPFTVRLQRRGERLRIEIVDGSPVPPAMRRFGAESTTGRGIRLVEELSGAWGWAEQDSGKVVWCEVTGGSDDAGWTPIDNADEVSLDALAAAFGEGDDGGYGARASSACAGGQARAREVA